MNGLQGFEVLGRVVFDVLDELLGFDDLDGGLFTCWHKQKQGK